MKLCHIVPSLEEQHGGPSKSVRLLCAALARAGHEIELLTTHPDASRAGDTQTEGALRITTYRREWPERICRSPGLWAALRASRPDVIHHHAIWLRTLHYAHRGAHLRGIPLVISPRGMMSVWAWRHHTARKRVAQMLVHPGALAAAAGWHATSEEEAAEIRELGFSSSLCIAPNGVDAPAPEEIAAARAYWHNECPPTALHRVALFYSRFHQKKRLLELIDLWLERGPRDWILLVVGIPEDYSPESLTRYVLNMSGQGRVQVFDGAGRPSPYAVASLFLLPSHNENFGLVIAEAMAHGVPALVTDTTPWGRLHDEGRGWCVPWAAYAETVATATAETTAQLRARGAKAQAWVRQEFSWDRCAAQLTAFYVGLTTRPK